MSRSARLSCHPLRPQHPTRVPRNNLINRQSYSLKALVSVLSRHSLRQNNPPQLRKAVCPAITQARHHALHICVGPPPVLGHRFQIFREAQKAYLGQEDLHSSFWRGDKSETKLKSRIASLRRRGKEWREMSVPSHRMRVWFHLRRYVWSESRRSRSRDAVQGLIGRGRIRTS